MCNESTQNYIEGQIGLILLFRTISTLLLLPMQLALVSKQITIVTRRMNTPLHLLTLLTTRLLTPTHYHVLKNLPVIHTLHIL